MQITSGVRKELQVEIGHVRSELDERRLRNIVILVEDKALAWKEVVTYIEFIQSWHILQYRLQDVLVFL